MSENKEFKVGGVVKLKSGGPNMTIVGISPEDGSCECKWFTKNGNTKLEEFDQEILCVLKKAINN